MTSKVEQLHQKVLNAKKIVARSVKKADNREKVEEALNIAEAGMNIGRHADPICLSCRRRIVAGNYCDECSTMGMD